MGEHDVAAGAAVAGAGTAAGDAMASCAVGLPYATSSSSAAAITRIVRAHWMDLVAVSCTDSMRTLRSREAPVFMSHATPAIATAAR